MQNGGRRPGAGRPKGSLSKNTLELAERLAEMGCDPFAGMMKLAEDVSLDPALRGRMYAVLAQYVMPKRRSVEMEAKVETVAIQGPNADSLADKLKRASVGRAGG